MARIVLGLGTSHSPQVSTVPELWHLHADRDRRNPGLDLPALATTAPPGLAAELSPEVYHRKHAACQDAIAALGDALERSGSDAVIIIGDDQRELFRDECSPAFAVYIGAELVDLPPDPDGLDPSLAAAIWSRHGRTAETYPTHPALARHLAAALMRQDFDVATAATQFTGRSLGHAYTFARLRLMSERVLPIVPVFINCYYPPNQPSAERCFAFGRALRRAIEAWEGPERIAVIASGGLSHFVIDEPLDRQVLAGIAEHRSELLRGIPQEKLVSGTSEIRNWIAVAGALQDFAPEVLNYVPAYRTLSGTGCGMAFVRWDPR